MTTPSASEQPIYKSKTHEHQVRALIQIDYPTPTALLNDQFSDQSIDTNIWAVYKPEGTIVSEDAGGFLRVATDKVNAPNGVLRPASVWSKPNKVFPSNKSEPFSLEWKCKPVYDSVIDLTSNYLPTAFRVCGIDNTQSVSGAIVAVYFNQQLGATLSMPDGTFIYGIGMDQAYHTYRLDWDGSNYKMYVDGILKATMLGTFGLLTFRGADFISIGVQGITANINSIWTEIDVDYIQMLSASAVPESPVTPAWATAPQTINGTRWDYLPSIISGNINSDKDNDVDAFEITCANYRNADFGNKMMMTNFRFPNRDIKIQSRQSDGSGNWTSWKTIFFGTVDDAQYFNAENGDVQVRITGRDKYRRQLQRTFITKSYADFATAITGIPNGKTVTQIVSDILDNEANIPSSKFSVATTGLVPKIINFINQDALSIIQELADDIVWEFFVQHENDGKLIFQDWQYPSVSLTTYQLSVYDEVILVNRAIGSFNQVGQVEVTFEQSNLEPFFAVYPVNRWPYDAAIIQVPSRITQTVGDLAGANPLHVQRWRRENRNFGSIEITCVNQDWFSMNDTVTVFDDIFLDIGDTQPITGTKFPGWAIDGWEYSWDANEFTSKARLVLDQTYIFSNGLRKYV